MAYPKGYTLKSILFLSKKNLCICIKDIYFASYTRNANKDNNRVTKKLFIMIFGIDRTILSINFQMNMNCFFMDS